MAKWALYIIYQGITQDLLLSIIDKKTSKEVWEAIKTVHLEDKVKKVKAQTLKAEFESLTMKEMEQLDDFCMKLTGLITNIRSLGVKIEEAYVVKKLLRVVPNKVLQIVSAIEQFGNMNKMYVEETVGSFKAHEERLCGKVDNSGEQQRLLTEGKESMHFTTSDGKECVLKEVYFIPNLCNNIISLGQLSESGRKVIIKGEYLWVYDENNNLLMKAKRSTNRLYKVIIKENRGVCLLTKA